MYTIQHSHIGAFLVASRDIGRTQDIVTEQALAASTVAFGFITEVNLQNMIWQLHKQKQLHVLWPDALTSRLDILTHDEEHTVRTLANQMQMDEGQVHKLYSLVKRQTQHTEHIRLYDVARYLEHSCKPNARLRLVYIHGHSPSCKVTATNDIRRGHKITICYPRVDIGLNARERRQLIKSLYDFHCECELCIAEDLPDDLISLNI